MISRICPCYSFIDSGYSDRFTIPDGGKIRINFSDGTDIDFYPLITRRGNILNAGVDMNGFKPVTFEELLENNRAFIERYLDCRLAERENEIKRETIRERGFLVDSLIGVLHEDPGEEGAI